MLKVNNLKKKFYTPKKEIDVLNNITFDVKKGDFISIIGNSGCGKSTILSILSGIEEKSDGDIIKIGRASCRAIVFQYVYIVMVDG